MTSGIYCIENLVNGKKYIGQGINVEKRMWEIHANSIALINAFKKYGEENFSRYVIEYCPSEELSVRETYYIKELKSHVSENGYNISWGGVAPMINRKHSEETIEKMSACKLGNKNPMFGTKGELCPSYGKPKSIEAKKKMSKAKKGKSLSDNHKKNIGLAVSKRVIKDSTREKYRIRFSGKNNPRFGKKSANATSKYFGVCKIKTEKHVYYRVTVNNIIIGNFKKELDAAVFYNEYVISNSLDRPLNII